MEQKEVCLEFFKKFWGWIVFRKEVRKENIGLSKEEILIQGMDYGVFLEMKFREKKGDHQKKRSP